MQAHSQLKLPSQHYDAENFQFYTQGRGLYQQHKTAHLSELMEERIRFQLEQSDRVQGF